MLQCHPPALKVTGIAKQDKATPVQAWKAPEGSLELRLPDFKTVGT
jgi:hypothetical protein